MKPRSLRARALQLLSQREQSRLELRQKLLAHARGLQRSSADAALTCAPADLTFQVQTRPGAGEGGGPGGIPAPAPAPVAAEITSPTAIAGANPEPARQGKPPQVRRDAGSDVDGEGADESELQARTEAEVDAVLDWLLARGLMSEERFLESRINARATRFGNLRIRHELARHGIEVPEDVGRNLAESEFARAVRVHQRKFQAPPASSAERARHARFLGARGFSSEVIQRVLRSSMHPGDEH